MKVKCKNQECLHEWNSRSKMIWITCPSCRLKTKSPKTKGEPIPLKQKGDASIVDLNKGEGK